MGKVIIIVVCVVMVCLLVSFRKRHRDTKRPYTVIVNNREYDVDNFSLPSDEEASKIEREIEELKQKNREWERQFSILMGFQNEGQRLEKEKDIQGAIEAYNNAVNYGMSDNMMRPNNFLYSVDRLAILYRKSKMYDNEITMIEHALSFDLSDRDKDYYSNRLEKAKLLKQKSNE